MSNEENSHKIVSEFQMRAALFTAVSILLVGWVLFSIYDDDYAAFYTLISLSVATIGGVSAIRYTIMCRDRLMGGFISYGRSVLWGLRFFLLSGMVLALGAYLFLRFHPDFISGLLSQYSDMMAEMQKMNQTPYLSIEAQKQQLDEVMKSSNISIAIDLWIAYCFFGTGASLLYSLFIKKESKQ